MTALAFELMAIINKSLLEYYKQGYYDKCEQFNNLNMEHSKCLRHKENAIKYQSALAKANNKIAKHQEHVEQLHNRIRNLEEKLQRYKNEKK